MPTIMYSERIIAQQSASLCSYGFENAMSQACDVALSELDTSRGGYFASI